MSHRGLVLGLFVLLLVSACKERPRNNVPPRSAAPPAEPTPTAEERPDASADAQETTPGADADLELAVDSGPTAPAMPSTDSIRWGFQPKQLDVMRETSVDLWVEWPGANLDKFRCEWDPGDRSGIHEGCRISHIFEGGMADRKVSLLVTYEGNRVYGESQTLPLERLPVHELAGTPRQLPPPPAPASGNRTVFAALHRAPDEADWKGLTAALGTVSPSLVLLFFNYGVSASEATAALEHLNGLGGLTTLPVFCNRSRLDAAAPTVKSQTVTPHGDDNAPPFRHAFMHAGTLYALLDPGQDEFRPAQEKWLLESLEAGKVMAHRVVVSCAPLRSYTGKGASELEPKFRWYEKLLRGDVSLLVSGLEPVYFQGQYGDQPTLNAGCVTGKPGRLLGTSVDQERTLSIVDFVTGRPPQVHPVSPKDVSLVLDQSAIPLRVGDYLKNM